jgi:ubiquinone/menaquinone biosynthesis C-methylase UbiE
MEISLEKPNTTVWRLMKMSKKAETTTKKTTTKTPKTEAVKVVKPELTEIEKLSQIYDKDYFENGIATKKSNYTDYSWARLGSYFQKTAKHIVDKFAPSSTLDVGCAKGFLVKALAGLGVDALGIDPSSYAIEESPRDTMGRLSTGIAQSIFLGDNSFDIVTCFDVLEHILEEDVPLALSEMLRVSKQWVILRIVTKVLPDGVDANHATIHDKDWWIEKIKEAGGIVEPTENYVNASVWWFNVPEFLIVARKAI